MEMNPQSIEKSDHIVWSSDEQGSGQPRSYTCSFCKKGFSNAQALGGHMNVHRKDRARLKFSDECFLSLEIAKNPTDHPLASTDTDSLQVESSEEKSCITKSPSCTLSREDDATPSNKDGKQELQQLPLFVETPLASNDMKAKSCASSRKEKMMTLSSSDPELDLELRLGTEPHEASTAGTREFF